MTALGDVGKLPSVLLVGGGKMGRAMLAGWREVGLAPSVVVDPSPEAASVASAEVTVLASPEAIPLGFAPSAVILAVKPQMASAVLPPYGRFAAGAVFLSIMAGQTVAGVAATIGAQARVVRAMPNTPAAVRQGITVAVAAAGVDPAERALCDRLLAAIGEVAWTADEALLDPVTAVSGSGPAYVFLLAELLEAAALAQGLPADLARRLARQTVIGAGALLAASPEDAADLRRAVTSPKGTTEAALGVLMAPEAWPRAIDEAVTAASRRSRELSG
jgi:pyrroline-5-carboxylate reductase